MRIRDIERGETWMTDAEHLFLRKFVKSMCVLFNGQGVQESPLLALRLADVAVHLLLARRQEMALTVAADGEGAAVPGITGALADQVSKGRERLRKAVRELEDACARLGKPLDTGLAEEMLPLVRKTRNILQNTVPPDGLSRVESV